MTQNSWNSTIPIIAADGGTGAATLTGVLTGNGTGAITAAAVTQYGVLVGDATNSVASTAVGTATHVLTSNGAGVAPTFQAPGSGVITLIEALPTSNGDATAIFTDIPLYDYYMVVIDNLRPAVAGANLLLTYSTNNGSTYITSGYSSGSNSVPYDSTTYTNTKSTAAYVLAGGSATGTPGCDGIIYLWNVSGRLITMQGQMHFLSNAASKAVNSSCMGSSTGFAVFDALKFAWSSGNFALSGEIDLYGITN